MAQVRIVNAAVDLLKGIEEAKPETITLIVEEMANRQATWHKFEALRDHLSFFLASSKAQREQEKEAQTPPTVPETMIVASATPATPKVESSTTAPELPDIPPFLDRRLQEAKPDAPPTVPADADDSAEAI